MKSNTGKALEAQVMIAANLYEHARILKMKKVDPPSVTRWIGGKLQTILLPNPFLDFIGVWSERGGRALFIEAKSTGEPRLPFGGAGGVTIQQMANLRAWDQAGAAVGVIWEYNLHYAFLSLENLNAAAQRGRKSIEWDQSPWITPDRCVVNFLPLLRTAYPK